MKIILFLFLAVLSISSKGHAQFFKRKLEDIKLAASQKVNDRIDQKSSQAMDTAMDKSERTVSDKLKSKKKKKKKSEVVQEPMENATEALPVAEIKEPRDSAEIKEQPINN